MKASINGTILFTFLNLITFNVWAECYFAPVPAGNGQGYIDVDINIDLSTAQSKPNNSVLYESPTQKYLGYSNYFCSTYSSWGIKNNVGTDSPSSDTFPIGDTGLAWKWIYHGVAQRGAGAYVAKANYTTGFTNSSHSMQLIKIGTIKNGAKIPSGILGYIQVEGFVQPLAMRTRKEISITPASCQASASLVQMGNDYQLEEFSKIGSISRTVKFYIHLSECQSGINQVTYTLLPTTSSQAIDWQQGIVALRSGQGAATGIGLRLMSDNGDTISLYTAYTFNGFNPYNTSFNIPFSAAYYRLAADKPTAGSAEASVTFVMNYL